MADAPITRVEQYISYLNGDADSYPQDPITRIEWYLYHLCKKGGIGGGTGESETTQVDHGTSDTTFTLPPNQFHIWGEVSSLTLTLGTAKSGVVNEYHFAFISGGTATTLSLPDTVITDIVVEPNMRYECSIINNLMTFSEWEVSA